MVSLDNIGAEIRRLRESQGLSQEQLARKLDVSSHTVGQWERAKQEPNLLRRRQIHELLGGDKDLLGIPAEEELPTPEWVKEIVAGQRRLEEEIRKLKEDCG